MAYRKKQAVTTTDFEPGEMIRAGGRYAIFISDDAPDFITNPNSRPIYATIEQNGKRCGAYKGHLSRLPVNWCDPRYNIVNGKVVA